MSSNPPFSATDFAEDTAYERLVLDRLGTHRVRVAEPSYIHDKRGTAGASGHVIVKVGTATMGTGLRDELAQSLRPLGFGAAYKVLDQLVEHVLRANGISARRFDQKLAALTQRPALLPPPLDAAPHLWDRLAVLYGKLNEARHAVTHRRAVVNAAGDLEIYDDQRRLIDTVSAAEIQAFAAAVHAAAEVVIEGRSDERDLNLVAWYLDALEPRHQLGRLGATDPNAHRRLLQMDLIEGDDGSLTFDVAQAREVVEWQEPSVWDIELYAGERRYVGHWEAVPQDQAAVEFHPASPPAWLSEATPV
jgi:hypothetical protein